MAIAAVVPALHAAGALATLASSAASALAGGAGAANGAGLNRMEYAMKRQEAAQLRTMEMQAEANIQKMMADTVNSIVSGHLDSGAKVQNACIKAAQAIQF